MVADADPEIVRVRASVRLLGPQEGGRGFPIRGSYRPNHNFFGPDDREMAIGFIEIPDGEEVFPGETIETTIPFWSFPGLNALLSPGREWRIQEGARLTAIGTVIEVLP